MKTQSLLNLKNKFLGNEIFKDGYISLMEGLKTSTTLETLNIFQFYDDYDNKNEEVSKYHDLIQQLLVRNKDFREKCSHFKMKIRSRKCLDVEFNFK